MRHMPMILLLRRNQTRDTPRQGEMHTHNQLILTKNELRTIHSQNQQLIM